MKRILISAAAFASTLGATAAHAQPASWRALSEPAEPTEPPRVHWGFELKAGPYFPDVDEEFAGDQGPFEAMFGDTSGIMGIFEADYFFLWPGGELGAFISAGYHKNSAAAYQTDDNGDIVMDENGPVRSEGDTTSFHLMPTAIGAVYRLSYLDDRFNVPIVPYGKIGLSYYIWWLTRPDGSVSEAGEGGCDVSQPMCETQSARGGTLGWQATAGFALRTERLDPSAAQNLRNQLGIQHVSLFVELTYANVDGLGQENRLHVGDLTWFAGLGFQM